MSAIAIRGFISGYMDKTAQSIPEEMNQPGRRAAYAAPPAATPGIPTKLGPATADLAAGFSPKPGYQGGTDPVKPPSPQRSRLLDMLKKWGGPAALGAAAVGGGSLAWDAMNRKKREAEGKPGLGIKKALLLSITMGIPLGLATKYLSSPQGRTQIAGLFNRGKQVPS